MADEKKMSGAVIDKVAAALEELAVQELSWQHHESQLPVVAPLARSLDL